MKPSIFISYSSQDYKFIKKLYDAIINTKALSIWQDNLGIRAGDKLNTVIDRAIVETDVCLFYLSEAAIQSEWVRRELKTALNKEKPLMYYFIDKEETREKLKSWPELKGTELRIPVINQKIFYPPLLELISTLMSNYYNDLYPNVNIDSVLEGSSIKGIKTLQQGRFTKKDDERVEQLIKSATYIKMMMFNANKFLDIFKEPLTNFFEKDNAKLYMLLADEESDFYNENSVLVSPQFDKNKRNQSLVPFAIDRATAIYHHAKQTFQNFEDFLKVKKFNTQFRLPLIIFDDRIVHLTINLPPSESSDGMTFEIENNSDKSYALACIKHFDSIWKISKDISVGPT